MSGIVGSNLNIKGSGLVAKLGTDGQVLTSGGAGVTAAFEDLAGGISWQAIETGSTMTAVAGEGYWVNTTSNACTITLPGSASNGDTIIFADYDRTWGTNGIVIDSNGLNYQGDDDSFDVEYGTDGLALKIVYSDATQGWIPILDEDVAYVPDLPGNQNGIFGYGDTGSHSSLTNLVSNAGVVATDVTGVGTARSALSATQYGGDKGIFGYGGGAAGNLSMTNLVSNSGVVSTDVTGVGTDSRMKAACAYGEDKGVFGYGTPPDLNITNHVSNVGVVAANTTGVGSARRSLGATQFGGDKGIFAYGRIVGDVSMSNLVANTGVVATDVTGVGTARQSAQGACGYGDDKGIFAYGYAGGNISLSNLVSNVGVVAADVTGVGSAREGTAGCEYSGDKGIFGYGYSSNYTAVTNLVSTVGVISTDVTGVGTVRSGVAACSYN